MERFKIGDRVLIKPKCNKCGYCFFCHLGSLEGVVKRSDNVIWVKFSCGKSWEFYSSEFNMIKAVEKKCYNNLEEISVAKKMIDNYNNKSSKELPEGAEVCAHCLKAQLVPITSQDNYLTMNIIHHYGSPFDGDREKYDICYSCYKNLIKIERNIIASYLE